MYIPHPNHIFTFVLHLGIKRIIIFHLSHQFSLAITETLDAGLLLNHHDDAKPHSTCWLL